MSKVERVYSVELEENSFNDDTFTGTEEEVRQWFADRDIEVSETNRIALIDVDVDEGVVVECINIFTE